MGGNNQCPVTGRPAVPHQESGPGAGRVLLRSAGEPAPEAPGSTTCPLRQGLMRGLCPETGREYYIENFRRVFRRCLMILLLK